MGGKLTSFPSILVAISKTQSFPPIFGGGKLQILWGANWISWGGNYVAWGQFPPHDGGETDFLRGKLFFVPPKSKILGANYFLLTKIQKLGGKVILVSNHTYDQ